MPAELWIHLDRVHYRHHAILAALPRGGYVTWCGLEARTSATPTPNPPARCRGCRSRMRLPYLLPERLRMLLSRVSVANKKDSDAHAS